MSRIKIDIPEQIMTSVEIPVRITDINYGNHLGNDSLVSIIHEARVAWLKENNFTELNAGGSGLIMVDLGVEYKGEAFYGDVLSITISSGNISRVSFDLFYLVETKRVNGTVIIAKAKTGMVCFDYEKRKPLPVTDSLRATLERRS